MESIRSVSRMVKEALKSSDRARKDDSWLYYLVCKKKLAERQIEIDSLSFKDGLLNRFELGLPAFETVRRSRQKMQERFPELAADSETQAIRSDREKAFREFARR